MSALQDPARWPPFDHCCGARFIAAASLWNWIDLKFRCPTGHSLVSGGSFNAPVLRCREGQGGNHRCWQQPPRTRARMPHKGLSSRGVRAVSVSCGASHSSQPVGGKQRHPGRRLARPSIASPPLSKSFGSFTETLTWIDLNPWTQIKTLKTQGVTLRRKNSAWDR